MATKKNEQTIELAQQIRMADISLSPLNPRKFIDEEALNELATSIEKYGVIQAIVIRPVKKGYEIVAGERRYRAANIAGLKKIPATVKELTDSEALEIAIIENLQRKDVHPMNEAVAFKQMQEQYQYGLAEIAGRLGRSEKYIAQRLKLNDLLEGFQEMFFKGDILLGHALELCKLSPGNQLYILDKIAQDNWNWRDIGSKPVSDLKSNINSSFRRQLAKATFDTADKELVPSAGPCTSCPHNTACNLLLFDEAEPICTNASCYDNKVETAFLPNLQRAIEDPSILLIYGYGGDEARVKKLKEAGHLLYEQYNDFNTAYKPTEPELAEVDQDDYEDPADYQEALKEAQAEYDEERLDYANSVKEFEDDLATGKILTGFWVNGSSRGKTIHVILGTQKASSNPNAPAEAQEANIQQKLKRGRELDAEKVHANISKTLFELPLYQIDGTTEETLLASEWESLYFFVYQQLGWQEIKDVRQRFGLSENSTGTEILHRISRMTDGEFSWVWRLVLRGKYKSSLPPFSEAKVVRKVAEAYIPEDMARLELDQEGIRERREAKLNKQLEDLKAEAL